MKKEISIRAKYLKIRREATLLSKTNKRLLEKINTLLCDREEAKEKIEKKLRTVLNEVNEW